ncbi:MAG: hypothetical protein RSA01_06715 [Clostridium sp.]|uniref:hypothetical protein n=1 Tax=Clostridium sp. TaxID=1506 RepID=UPI002FC88E7B
MMHFSTMTSKELTLLSAVLAIEIAEGADIDELNIIGNFLVGVGTLLLVIDTQEQFLNDLFSGSSDESTPIHDGVPCEND